MIGNRISGRVAHAGSRIRSVRVATATLTVGAVTALAIAPAGLPSRRHDSGPGAHTPTRTAKLLDVRRPADRKRDTRTDRLPTRQEIEAIAVPLDRELAGVVRMLKAAGIDQMALQAAQVIIASRGQLTVESLQRRGDVGLQQHRQVAHRLRRPPRRPPAGAVIAPDQARPRSRSATPADLIPECRPSDVHPEIVTDLYPVHLRQSTRTGRPSVSSAVGGRSPKPRRPGRRAAVGTAPVGPARGDRSQAHPHR